MNRRVLSTCVAVFLLAFVWSKMDLLADSFWYIASGRSVLAGEGFPAVDPFSFTSLRTRWIVHMPGSVVLFSWLDRALGLRAIIALATLVETAALLLLWLGRRADEPTRWVLFPVVAFSVVLQRDDLCARGQVFGDLFFVGLLLAIDHLRRREHVRLDVLAGAAFSFGAAWVNLHSSFVLAAIVPLVAWVGALCDPAEERPNPRRFVVFIAGALAGMFVNPYGFALVRDVLALASHETTFKQKLFVSPDFRSWDTLVCFAIAASAMVVRVSSNSERRRSDLVLLLAFVGLAASGHRYLPHLLYLSIFVLGGTLPSVLPSVLKASAVVQRFDTLRSAWLRTAVGLLAIVFGVLLARTPKDPYAHVPIAAAQLAARANGSSAPILNEYHWGGFLLYAWMGSPKVFVDGRSYLYYNGVFEDAQTLESVGEGARELLDVYEFHTALLERGSPLALALESLPNWVKIHEDRLAVVLVRKPNQ